MAKIATLFDNDITRQIEEVIKVDQTSADIIASEIDEYVVTDAIKKHFVHVLERYQETPQKPHEGVAIWISGFFGSGKSSFAKVLGLAIEDRNILGTPAAKRFAARANDAKLNVVLNTINEKIPTHTVIFDVSTDRGIRSGNQMLTEIMYRLFLASLGYAKDIDLAELEIGLEAEGRFEEFKKTFQSLHGKDWDEQKGMTIFALNEASAVLHKLNPATYPMADSWSKGRPKMDITAGRLADRIVELMKRRKPGHSLMFVVDEVGQFVARDTQKMLDLQGIVQQLGVKGRGKYWIAVTSQERLSEVVSGLDDRRIELPKLMDRFPLQVHLEPSDISEVTSRRVLKKTSAAETVLGRLYDDNRARLDLNSRITADVTFPALSRERFVDLYPLLPYQIDLIIDIEPMPEVIRDDMAFIDRLHFYLPGWEIPKMRNDLFTDHYGFVVDYLAEALRELRRHNFTEISDRHFTMGSHLVTRDRKAVKKTVSGLMKIIHPNGEATQDEIAELLEFAMEGRRRVKEQLKKMGSFEYYHTSFSYTLNDTGEERFVGVPEQGGRNLISADPLPPGSVYTATVSPDGTVGMYRVEVSVSAGSGKIRTAGGVSGVTKESIGRAFSYMLAKKGDLLIAKELDVSDLHVEVIDLMNNRVEGEIGLAFFIAAFSALKKAPPAAAMLVLGDLSVQGNIKGLRSLAEPLQLAMDNGAKRALIPLENKRSFLEVTGDVVEHVDPIFFGDPKTAAFKALGLN